jgi:hypothetical protein
VHGWTQSKARKSLLLKRKAVSSVTLLVFNFALRQNTKLPTNTTNKLKKWFILF